MPGPGVTNAEIFAKLDFILTALVELKAQVSEMEYKRQSFRQEYDQQSGETAKVMAVIDHRLTAAEKRIDANTVAISSLAKTVDDYIRLQMKNSEEMGHSIERMKASVTTVVKLLTSVGMFMLLWVIGQWLNLI